MDNVKPGDYRAYDLGGKGCYVLCAYERARMLKVRTLLFFWRLKVQRCILWRTVSDADGPVVFKDMDAALAFIARVTSPLVKNAYHNQN